MDTLGPSRSQPPQKGPNRMALQDTARSIGTAVRGAYSRSPAWHDCSKCGRSHGAPFKMCRTCRVAAALQTSSWREGQFRQKLCLWCVEPMQRVSARETYNPISRQRGHFILCKRHHEINNAQSRAAWWQRRGSLAPEQAQLAQVAADHYAELRGLKAASSRKRPATRKAA